MSEHYEKSLALHKEHGGKWEVRSKVPLKTQYDLTLAYTPGVAGVCEVVAKDRDSAYTLTMKGSSVAIVSDGSAVLGLGNIGPEAALPVMEGKAILFKEFGGIDGVPVVFDTSSPKQIINAVKAIAPTFGGINLEDIAAPACFEIEEALQDIGIPVFHDDQHGTAVVLLAALMNASKVVGKKLGELSVVINGAGAAGVAIARLLGASCEAEGLRVREIVVCDSKGALSKDRSDLNSTKEQILEFTNRRGKQGSLQEVLAGADVFIGVSKGNLLTKDDISRMAEQAIVCAMANPTPEIMPDEARAGGAKVVCTGRSDFPNQVNNVLAFPGIFRGALDARAERITEHMKIAAARALAGSTGEPTAERILPDPLDKSVARKVAAAVCNAAKEDASSGAL